METCYFCKSINEKSGLDFIDELETDLFIVAYDINPATPGHALIIPKRHIQYMKSLSEQERNNLIELAVASKEFVRRDNLVDNYEKMLKRVTGTKSEEYIRKAISELKRLKRQPDAFNDGLNDGPAAGQTVPHFHWHILPRWDGDMSDPRGGIRHMFTGMGNYHNGIALD